MATIEQAIETIVQAKVDDAEARNERLKKHVANCCESSVKTGTMDGC